MSNQSSNPAGAACFGLFIVGPALLFGGGALLNWLL